MRGVVCHDNSSHLVDDGLCQRRVQPRACRIVEVNRRLRREALARMGDQMEIVHPHRLAGARPRPEFTPQIQVGPERGTENPYARCDVPCVPFQHPHSSALGRAPTRIQGGVEIPAIKLVVSQNVRDRRVGKRCRSPPHAVGAVGDVAGEDHHISVGHRR